VQNTLWEYNHANSQSPFDKQRYLDGMPVEEAQLDLSQVTQLLTWLDEEHRKDKALLIDLQGRVSAYQPQLTEQARQLQEIQAALTRIEGQLPKLALLEDSIQETRSEFANLLAERTTDQELREEQRARAEKQESETRTRIVRQLQERVDALGSFHSSAALLRDEDSRLQSELTNATEQLAEASKRLGTQEQRVDLLTKDARVLREALTNMKVAHEDLSTLSMTLRAAVESLQPRLDSKIKQLQSSLEEMSNRRQADLSSLQVKLQEQDRLVEELTSKVNAFQTSLARWTKQMEEFTSQFERNRKTLYELQELERQMRQQASELLELQRLAAERQRTELREWQDAQIRVDEEQMARLEQLETWQRRATEATESLIERLEQDRRDVGAGIDELWQAWAEYMRGQTEFLDSVVRRRGAS